MFGDPLINSKGWTLNKLGNLTSKIGSGSTPRGGEASYKLSGIPLIRSMNVYNYSFAYTGLAYIDEKQAKALGHVTVTQNDVLLNITGASVARCTIVPPSLTPARVNQHVAILRTKADLINSVYLVSLINSTTFKEKLLSLARSKGATREALTKDELQNLTIPVPPLEIQEKFADIEEKIVSTLDQYSRTVQQSDNFFNSLIQRAFRGEL
nr:restriction endonuclease subunit S [Leptolyngbya sp. FACHB-17]